MKHTTPILLAAALLACTPITNAQSFTNGSFEDGFDTGHPDYYPGTGHIANALPPGWSLFSNTGTYPNTSSPDWFSDAVLGSAIVSHGNHSVGLDSFHPYSGSNPLFAELDEYMESGISQTVSGFVPMEFYEVSFDAANWHLLLAGNPFAYGQPGFVDFYIDGIVQGSHAVLNQLTYNIIDENNATVDGSFLTYSFVFQAPSSSVEIGIRNRIAADPGDVNAPTFAMFVDNFQVNPVPEPSGALLLTLAGTLAVLRRRRAA